MAAAAEEAPPSHNRSNLRCGRPFSQMVAGHWGTGGGGGHGGMGAV